LGAQSPLARTMPRPLTEISRVSRYEYRNKPPVEGQADPGGGTEPANHNRE
jgi:hypothetical protein